MLKGVDFTFLNDKLFAALIRNNLTIHLHLRTKFSRGDIIIYLHFMSLLQIDMAQVVEIPAHVRQGPSSST